LTQTFCKERIMQMAKDYKIYTILNSQRKVTVEVIGEMPQAMRRGRDH